jgi:alpha-N-arabinofuranosidase
MAKLNSDHEIHLTGMLLHCLLLFVMAAVTATTPAQSNSGAAAQLDVNVTSIVSPVSPTLYGLMTEEINHSYDAGSMPR